ncbi:MAG TPA: ferrochelatase [Phenylobacterium sp.]|uniref:ferrochelatase n=1 Tax=Phenylobacterium sp. TaxID=1871053 RepID=UPI002C54AD0A|nr:ferrochelatase [Phenylobacterium sp.]HXA38942.1 ferrochelatase [Phenylobacterium sp.]
MTKLAVVLFNLGGPDGLRSVKPFLFNLFRDPAIITLPAVARYPLAALIATTREKTAQGNYAIMGGASPLLPETQAQATALEAALAAQAPDVEARCFIAMRYWKPFAKETARAVAAFAPDEIVLLPLYPQYSTTTTASSAQDWARAYSGTGRTRTVCCYPTALGLIETQAEAIRKTWIDAGRPSGIRLLFSAHGLPQQVVDAGDPYQTQVEATAAMVAARLPEFADWRVCYQSRVGRLKWLAPSTDDEVRRAGAEGKGVLIAPIAFVSEHVETLVELDHEYAHLAKLVGCTPYLRAPTPGVQARFIDELAGAVLKAAERPSGASPHGPWRCPAGHAKCALRTGNAG